MTPMWKLQLGLSQINKVHTLNLQAFNKRKLRSTYAISHGSKEAIRHYMKQYCVEIRESSVSTWKGKYTAELK